MKQRLLLTTLLCAALAAFAGPAPWYKWNHPEAERPLCSQVPPGEGWVKIGGPYQDSQCRKPGNPGDS